MSDTHPAFNSVEEILKREAAFRARAIRDFTQLERDNRTRQEEIDRLNHLVGAKDTYIHRLHLEREALRKELLSAREEVEFLTHQNAQVEDQSLKASFRLRSIESSVAFALARPLIAAERALSPMKYTRPAFLPGRGNRYHLVPSPYRVLSQEAFTFDGWVEEIAASPVRGVRVRIGDLTVSPEAIQGSELEVPTGALTFRFSLKFPIGRSWLQLEAQSPDGTWFSLLNVPMWRRPETSV